MKAKSVRLHLLLVIGACLLAGCGERTSVGGSDYVMFTPDTLPDGHPGTVLRYKGKEVWPSVHPGYFDGSPEKFYRDGVFVFLGSIPSRQSGSPDYLVQLFAIRGAGPPVLISARATHQPLTECRIEHISPTVAGFRLESRFWTSSKGNITNEVRWADIVSWLKEAESVPVQQETRSEMYRILP